MACAFAALVGASTLAAPAHGDVRVSSNFAMRPDPNPVHGRDALGLAVNPRNKDHIVAVYADWASLWCEVATSFDGGSSWRRTRLKAPAGFIWPPCTVGGHLSGQLDGSIAFGRKGRVYTAFSSAVVDDSGEPEAQSVLVSRSTDGGRTFRPGLVVLRGGSESAEGPEYILPKLTVQRRRGKPDRIYVVAGAAERDDSGVVQERTVLTVSHDGGIRWSPRREASPSDQNAIESSQPVLGRKGALHLAWRTRGRTDRPGRYRPEGTVVVATSHDHGVTWERTHAADVRGYVHEGPPQLPFFPAGAAFTASTFPRLAADRRSGSVYLVYGDGGATAPGRARAADHFIHPDMDVYFQRSEDGGDSWTAPRRLNGAPPVRTELTQTRHPNVSVAPNGRVDVVWHDRRHWYRGCTHTHAACQEARLGDTYYRHSDDGGVSFSRDRRITDRSINNDVGFDYRFGAYWEFGPVIVPRGKQRALVGWMDSREGNPDTDTMGIFLSHIRHHASPRVPRTRLRSPGRDAFAIRMSRLAYPGGAESVLAGTFASRPWSRVVIVNRHDAMGAMAGGVLARAFLGPVLVAGRGGLSNAAKAELARLAPVGAFLIGGEGSLSEQVERDLAETGIPADEITRLTVPGDEAGTLKLVAEAADWRTEAQRQNRRPAFNGAILVNPDSPDAVAASVLAANRRLPVFLTGRNGLPAATAEALEYFGITRTLLIGSRRWIGREVADQVPKPHRLAGSNAYRTSRVVLSESIRRGVPDNIVYAVKSSRRMDAALLGATVGRAGGLLLLTKPGGKGPRAVLKSLEIRDRVDRLVVRRPR